MESESLWILWPTLLHKQAAHGQIRLDLKKWMSATFRTNVLSIKRG